MAEKQLKRHIKQQILERMTVEQLDELHHKYVGEKKDDIDPKKYIQPGSLADISYTLLESRGGSRKSKIEELAKELKLDFIISQIAPQYKLDISDILAEYANKMEIVNKM